MMSRRARLRQVGTSGTYDKGSGAGVNTFLVSSASFLSLCFLSQSTSLPALTHHHLFISTGYSQFVAIMDFLQVNSPRFPSLLCQLVASLPLSVLTNLVAAPFPGPRSPSLPVEETHHWLFCRPVSTRDLPHPSPVSRSLQNFSSRRPRQGSHH